MRKNGSDQDGEGSAQSRSEIKRRREDATGGAASETDGCREQFQDKQQCKQARGRHLIVERRLDDAIADAIHIRMAEEMNKNDHHQADRRHAENVLGVDVPRQFGEPVLHDYQQTNECPGGDAAQDSEQDESDRFLKADQR